MRKYEIAVVSKNGYARTVRIFAPKKADRAVIMHDGQNVFYDSDAAFGKSWRALDALKELGIKNTAIIGIDSITTRYDDYIAFPSEIPDERIGGGRADAYLDYIDDGIVPYLDKRFGFKLYGMMGSSAGSLATLYYAARKNKKFKAYGLLSTPLFIAQTAFDKFLDSAQFDADSFYEVYVGGRERSGDHPLESIEDLYVNDAFKVVTALRKSDVKNMRLTIENDGIHDETCWRAPQKRFLAEFSEILP